MKSTLLIPMITILFAGCSGIPENPAITEDELFQHISYLASDSLKGRLPGTEEDKLAALYIASEFKKAGLSFHTDDGLQSFEVITDLKKGEANSLRFESKEYNSGEDFAPFPFTANATLDAEVVFAGYGFDLNEEEITWNDYTGVDVTGKWVMVLRGNPEIDSTVSVFHAHSGARNKAMLAADQGAGGILFVSGTQFSTDDELIDLRRREGKVGIPAIHISRKLADRILDRTGMSIELLENQLNTKRFPASMSTDVTLEASAEVNTSMTTTYNVIGYLEGSDPERKDEHIIIGAHYDHLGMGGPGSSSRKPDTIAVHNGADDNASGVAALIEIAEKLNGADRKPANSYLFIAFGAEEMGLLGSKHYVDNPLLPLDQARIMINMDMVGRLRNEQLQVGGVGTAVEIGQIVDDIFADGDLKLSTTREGYGASDHSSFYGKDIPVLFITTGAHADYHKPDDDVEFINLEGMVTISNYVSEISGYLDSTNVLLTFQEAGPKVRFTRRHGLKITLGITPDYTDNDDQQGMRVDFVTPGRQAHIGGMQEGDFIMAIDGNAINGIYDYMYRLSKLSKGQVIVVTVKREDKTLDLLVQL
jgi:hypothetical protein